MPGAPMDPNPLDSLSTDYSVTFSLEKFIHRVRHSEKLNATQRAWFTIEKEAFAVLEALKRFATFIFWS
jgi:hypothetical protein